MTKVYQTRGVVPPWTMAGKQLVLRHQDPDDGGGGDEDFQTKVLDGVKTLTEASRAEKKRGDTLQQNIAKMIEDFDRLDKATKDTFKDIETFKKAANDSASNQTAMLKRFEMLDARLKMQARGSFGSPMERLLSDHERRTRLNLAFRLPHLSRDPALRNTCKEIIERSDLPNRDELQDAVKRALGEDSSPGSTMINTDLHTEVYHTLQSYGIWNTFDVVPTLTKTNTFLVQTARPVALALSENVQLADDANKTGTSVECTTKIVAALLNVPFTLLEDAEIDLTGNLMEDFAEAYAFRLDWFCTQADGTNDTTDGTMTGIFGGGGTAAAATAGKTTVEATSLTDWQNCLLTVDAAVLQRPAKWWLHPQILVRALSIQDLNGRPLFQTALEAPSAGAVGSILGYPLVLGAQCPTTNAASAKVAVFGDPKGQVVGLRKQYAFEFSDHFKWDYLQRSYRAHGRAGTKIRAATAFGVLTLAAV